MSNIEIYKRSLIALLLAFLVTAMLPACSSSDEAEDTATEDTSGKDELCDEADFGTTGCPE